MKKVYKGVNGSFQAREYTGGDLMFSSDIIEIEDSTYEDLINHKLMWRWGSLIPNPNYEQYKKSQEAKQQKEEMRIEQSKNKQVRKQIEHYKNLLRESDYRALKFFEGYYTEEQYQPYKLERQSYRDKINELEKELTDKEENE